MTEFVDLRAKMYAYRKIDKNVEEKRCKGTKKCVVAEGLTFGDCKTCLFDGETISQCLSEIISKKKKKKSATASQRHHKKNVQLLLRIRILK